MTPTEGASEQQRGASSSPRLRRPGRYQGDDAPKLYRLAYEEGQRALDDQIDELNGMRNRATQFTAFVGAATAFLAGTGLKVVDRGALFYSLAIVASLISIFAIANLGRLLMPRRQQAFHFRMSSKVLVEDWIINEVPGPTEVAMLRELALEYDQMRTVNEGLLSHVRQGYRRVVVGGGIAVLAWAALAWLGG